jgi:hypothetical protein
MTRDEIRLIVFVLLAIALGSTVKWWREQDPRKPAVAHVEERKSGWADPPYVFKSKACDGEDRNGSEEGIAGAPSGCRNCTCHGPIVFGILV